MNMIQITNTLKGSTKPIVAISPWKRLLATSSEDGSLKIWNTDTWRVIHGFMPTCFAGTVVTSIVWRSDKTLLVSADTVLYTLSLPTDDDAFLSRTAQSSASISTEEINALLTLDGNRVAASDDAGTINIFNVAKSCVTRTLYHGGMVTCLALHGESLVSGSLDAHLKVWHRASFTQDRDIDVAAHRAARAGDNEGMGMGMGMINPAYVHALTTGPRGIVCAGLGDGGVFIAQDSRQAGRKRRVWRVGSVTAHGLPVNALAVLGDAKQFLITASSDKTCKMWLLDSLFDDDDDDDNDGDSRVEALSTVQVPAKVNAMAVLSDTQVVVGDVLGNLIILTISSTARGRK